MSQQIEPEVTDQFAARACEAGANRLGDRLQRRIVMTAFPQIAQGFLEDLRQRRGVEQAPTDEEIVELFAATLTFLYRLLFLLYAESRELLPVGDPAYYAVSLRKIREEIAAGQQVYSDAETALNDRLVVLFKALDKGDPVLKVPAYKGGLFHTASDTDGLPPKGANRADRAARFLREHKVSDGRLAVAIDAISRDRPDRMAPLALIDYKSLDIRRMGSIYEALLDSKLQLRDKIPAPAGKIRQCPGGKRNSPGCAARAPECQLYLANGNVKRKASGSYYTPPTVVEYLVANTIGPVLDEKLEPLRRDFRKAAKKLEKDLQKSKALPAENQYRDLLDRLFDLKVVDPAMGCGHFLGEAVNFIAGRLLDFLNEFPNNPVHFALARTRQSLLQSLAAQGLPADRARLSDRHLLKRHVLDRCIYGVDLDPMAVELAKASLLLETSLSGVPFSFLDHHLRCGNALVGATFDHLRQLLRGSLHRVRFDPLLRALGRISPLNERIAVSSAEVQQSAEEHEQARHELSGYEVLFDLLVASHFGFPEATDVLTHVWKYPTWDLSSRESFLQSVAAGDGRKMAEQAGQIGRRPDLRFFHWETQFPDAYFTFVDPAQRQMKPKNDWIPGSAGFDCVVGNPPYVRIQGLDETLVAYLQKQFESARGKFDLYIPFLERGTALLRENGLLGMIVPNKFLTAHYGTAFREFAARNRLVRQLVDFESQCVFPGAGAYCCLLFLGRRASDNVTVSRGSLELPIARETSLLPSARFGSASWSARFGTTTLPANGIPLKAACQAIFQGLITGADRLLIGRRDGNRVWFGTDSVEFDPEILRPVLKGPDIRRFALRFSEYYVLYPYQVVDGRTELMAEEEIAARHPGAYRYLRAHRRELESRGSKSMAYPAWYAHWCPRTIDRFTSPKIVTQVLSSRASFALDRQGAYTFVGGGNAGVYGVVPKDAEEDRLWLLLAILNSRSFDAQVKERSSRFRGGYFSYARRFIEDAAIPQLDGLDRASGPVKHLIDLARRRVEENSQTSAPLDAEIDAAVEELFRCGIR